MVFFFLEMATGVTSNEEGEEARGGLLRGRFPLQMSKLRHPSCCHVASSSSPKIQLIDALAACLVTRPHQSAKMKHPSTAHDHGCRFKILSRPLQDSHQLGNITPCSTAHQKSKIYCTRSELLTIRASCDVTAICKHYKKGISE